MTAVLVDSKQLYLQASKNLNKQLTKAYSTSFSLALRLVDSNQRQAIYNIYGFVRMADELVDSWRPRQMHAMLTELELDTIRAIKSGVSLNPVVLAFAQTVKDYNIDPKLIKAFLHSMTMDITKKTYTQAEYQTYIYGSAEVVGLMCLWVYCDGKVNSFHKLERSARALGAGFQKVNFLRDLSADSKDLGRAYFPGVNPDTLDEAIKKAIVQQIQKDFDVAQKGIKQLPVSSKYAVW